MRSKNNVCTKNYKATLEEGLKDPYRTEEGLATKTIETEDKPVLIKRLKALDDKQLLQRFTNLKTDNFRACCVVCFEDIIDDNGKQLDEDKLSLISETLQLEIFTPDEMDSHHICNDCHNVLTAFSEFRLNCTHLQKYFRDFCQVTVETKHVDSLMDDNEPKPTESRPISTRSSIRVTKRRKLGSKKGKITKKSTHTRAKLTSCPFCAKTFRYPHMLHAHIRIHTGEKPLLCHICGQTFQQWQQLSGHIKNHAQLTECPVCKRKFYNSGILKMHLKIHAHERSDTTYLLRCNGHCNAVFRDTYHLRAHLKNVRRFTNRGKTSATTTKLRTFYDRDKKRYVCDKCKFSTCMTFYFQSHLFSHENESPSVVYDVPCEHCERMFKNGASLLQHMTRVRNCARNKNNKLAGQNTNIRNETGDGNDNLNLAQFYDKSKKKYVCSICRYATNSCYIFQHYQQHNGQVDTNYDYECTLCQRLFQAENELKSHVEICQSRMAAAKESATKKPVATPSIPCNLCNKMFGTNLLLKRHTLKMHDAYSQYYNDIQKVYVCPTCKLPTAVKTHFLNHLKLHKKEPSHVAYNFTCPNCERLFKTRNFLAQHQTSCGSFAAIACVQCPLTFDTPRRLKRHVSLAHSSRLVEYFDRHMRNYVCPTCRYKSTDTVRFRKHLAMHVNEAEHVTYAHECKTCGMLFNQAKSLTNHEVGVHVDVTKFYNAKARLYKCDHCGDGIQNPANFRAHISSHSRKIAFRHEKGVEL